MNEQFRNSEQPRNNVFLSYRHADNTDGWVTALHAYLEKRMPQLLGLGDVRDARVWRDPQLGGGSALWKTIETELDSAVFISVLSPGYLKSDACLREAKAFRARAVQSGGLLVGNTARWIRVVKTPFSSDDEPDFLREIETIELRFYKPVPQTAGRFREFPAEEGESGKEFRDTAEELAQAVCGLLQKMARKVPKPASGRPKVFLADTTSDRHGDRSFIAAELGADFDVVPTVPAPVATVEEIHTHVADALRDCVLAVHVLGARYGLRPEGEEVRSIVHIQLDETAGVRRLVWIPDDLTAIEPRQTALLQALESSQSPTLEVIRSGRQAFLQHARDVLAEIVQPAELPALGKSVYLVSDQKDLTRPQLRDLANCLLRHGFFVE
jgi:hypothetical protein